jgi:hypothetical protein
VPPQKLPQLTAEQTKAIVRTYALGGRLLHALFEKFIGLMEDERVAADSVGHAKFIARSVCHWVEKTLADVGLRVQIGLSVALYTGRAWDDTNGVEIELEFPKVFSKVIVDAVLKQYTILEGREHLAGHLDDYDYAEVMRGMVTAEGCNEPRPERKNEDDSAASNGAD